MAVMTALTTSAGYGATSTPKPQQHSNPNNTKPRILMKNSTSPFGPSGSVNGLVFLVIMVSALGLLYIPNMGMKTRSSSTFAINEVQMRPLIVIPDVATQLPTQSADDPWWNKDDIAAKLDKIATAIKDHEAMTNHRVRSNTLHPDRLTVYNEDGYVFVEIKGNAIRVGDLTDGKQIVGTLDGAMPTSGVQNLSPDDSIGYPPSISSNAFGQRGANAVSRKAYTPMWYEETITRVADAILTPP